MGQGFSRRESSRAHASRAWSRFCAGTTFEPHGLQNNHTASALIELRIFNSSRHKLLNVRFLSSRRFRDPAIDGARAFGPGFFAHHWVRSWLSVS